MKVIIQWEQWIWRKLAKHAAQLLFDSVHGVEKIAAIDVQLARAQPPVSAKQKVISKQPMLFRGQVSARDQTEIRDELLILPSPSIRPIASYLRFQRNSALMPLLGNAFYKPVMTEPENRAQHAVTGR